MPRDDDDETNDDDATDDDTSDESTDDAADSGADDDADTGDADAASAADDTDDATQAVASASPEEDDAHRGMLGEVLNVLDGQGIDVNQLAQQYGLPHMDVDNMSADQIVQLTQKLAQEHPDLVSQVSQQFPMAQGLLGSLTGGQGAGGVGGLLGRLLH